MSKYKLIWSEEFDYEGKVNPDKWTYITGDIGVNNELQCYTDSLENVLVKDNKLTITLKKQKKDLNDFTSGRIVTRGKMAFVTGKIEVKAKIPVQKGSWPAIWMLADDASSWPDCGEIDIMEHVVTHGDQVAYAIHTNHNNHTNNTAIGKKVPLANVGSDYNIYGLEITEDELIFFLDEKEIGVIKKSDVCKGLSKEDEWKAWPFTTEFHLILNIATGGWGGPVEPDFVSDKMEVEYVRVYQRVK